MRKSKIAWLAVFRSGIERFTCSKWEMSLCEIQTVHAALNYCLFRIGIRESVAQ